MPFQARPFLLLQNILSPTHMALASLISVQHDPEQGGVVAGYSMLVYVGPQVESSRGQWAATVAPRPLGPWHSEALAPYAA